MLPRIPLLFLPLGMIWSNGNSRSSRGSRRCSLSAYITGVDTRPASTNKCVRSLSLEREITRSLTLRTTAIVRTPAIVIESTTLVVRHALRSKYLPYNLLSTLHCASLQIRAWRSHSLSIRARVLRVLTGSTSVRLTPHGLSRSPSFHHLPHHLPPAFSDSYDVSASLPSLAVPLLTSVCAW